jgi:hypothetical protein
LDSALSVAIDISNDDIRIWHSFGRKGRDPATSKQLAKNKMFSSRANESRLRRHLS